MSKKLTLVLAVVFVLSLVSTALAAPPLVDVPAGHWAYQSVAKLSEAGIINGYGDTARDGKTLTRYEFAIITAKAMINQEKADTEHMLEIAKLQAEFSDELEKLGIRAPAKQKKASDIKISGEVRTRFESSKDSADSPQNGTRLRLGVKAQLTDELAFIGKYEAETAFGPAGASNDNAHLTQAYLSGKALGFDVIILGRQFLLLGQGLLADADGPADGLVLGSFIDGQKLLLVGGCLEVLDQSYLVANLGYNPNKNLSLSTSYAKDNNDEYYKSWAAGFTYKGIPDIGLTFEYGTNSADKVKHANGGDSAKAWMAKAKYLGADSTKPKSYGLWIGYRSADPLFDNLGFTTFNNDYARAANTGTATPYENYSVGPLKNVKGFQYGMEYTVFENAIAKIMYNDLEDKRTGQLDASNVICQLTYNF